MSNAREFESLIDATVAQVNGMASRMIGDPALAEQVVAEVYLRAWREHRDEPHEQRMLALVLACREVALEAIRRNPAAARHESDLALEMVTDSAMHSHLLLLDPMQRRLVGLALLRGLDDHEIARHTGIESVNVASMLRKSVAALAGHPALPLEEVLFTEELGIRPLRAPDHAAEGRALSALAEYPAKPCQQILDRLVETAQHLCGAHSAGVSILERTPEGTIFRWNAVVGAFACHRDGFLPRDDSPCGIVVDRDATLLMKRPARHFVSLRGAVPELVEALVVPFHLLEQCVGTVWALAHDDDLHFDSEHARALETIAEFASASYLMRSAQDAALEARDELIRDNDRLRRSNERMTRSIEATAGRGSGS